MENHDIFYFFNPGRCTFLWPSFWTTESGSDEEIDRD